MSFSLIFANSSDNICLASELFKSKFSLISNIVFFNDFSISVLFSATFSTTVFKVSVLKFSILPDMDFTLKLIVFCISLVFSFKRFIFFSSSLLILLLLSFLKISILSLSSPILSLILLSILFIFSDKISKKSFLFELLDSFILIKVLLIFSSITSLISSTFDSISFLTLLSFTDKKSIYCSLRSSFIFCAFSLKNCSARWFISCFF